MLGKAQEEYDCLYKIVLVGDSGVGKSNILSRFITGTFSFETKTTIGVEFSSKIVALDKFTVLAQLWDTAGQERYRSITKAYYKGAIGAIIVYDITNEKSFESLVKWTKEIKDNAECNVTLMLVGNKCDLNETRKVAAEDGIAYAAKNGKICW